MKNAHAQEMQKLSVKAQKKKLGTKAFKLEMARRANARWDRLKKLDKIS